MKKYSSRCLQRILGVLLILATILLFAGPSGAATQPAPYSGPQAKYVILLIGDGMGIPQRTAAEAYTGEKLAMDTLPVQGITTTSANDRFITGSAAAATALASGIKTNINYLGVDPAFKPVKTVAEMARDQGKKVGIISSVSIDHATPAAFYAHVKTREMYYEIDCALARSGFDFFGGGGLKDPLGKKSEHPRGDAMAAIKSTGYKVVTDKEEFEALKPGSGKVLAYNSWLQDDEALPYALDRRGQDISLAEFTAKAIELLDNDKGFFLMVEGGKIDWACHANDGRTAIDDTIAFDNAVKEALKFYNEHPADTLVVITGDHECGGLTLGFAGTKYASHFQIMQPQKISFQQFDAEVFKSYKQSCNGKCSFDDVKPVITSNFGLKFEGDSNKDPSVLEPFQVTMLQAAYDRSMGGEMEGSKNPETYLQYGGYEPLTVTITHILNNKAGLGWTSFKHTGVPVSTSAIGVGAQLFNGYYDNTDVAKRMMAVLGISPEVHYASN